MEKAPKRPPKVHISDFQRFAQNSEPTSLRKSQGTRLIPLKREYANLLVALEWSLKQKEAGGRIEATLQLAAALGQIWFNRGELNEGRSILEQALSASSECTELVSMNSQANALFIAGSLAYWQYDYDQAGVLIAEAFRTIRGYRNTPGTEQSNYERTMAEVRSQPDERTFAEPWIEGQSMTPVQALGAGGRTSAIKQASKGATAPLTTESSTTNFSASSRSPGALTPRENEVLCLIAAGLTNKQIAERLVISPSTVDTHIQSIYNKLGISSRSAATRYAIEHRCE